MNMVIKDEVREQIVEASRNIFRRYGFRKTTMDEIAMSMRKGKSSIYYYFKSKEEIYKSVIEKEAEILKDAINDATNAVDDPIEKLRQYISVRMRTFVDLVNFYEAIKNEMLSHLDFVNKAREKYDQDEMEMVEAILKIGVKKGKFAIEDTELAAIAIVTAMKGLEVPLFWKQNYADIDQRIKDLLNVLFYGIVKK
jgi:AcrR family transcriptional regulator